MNTCNNRNSRIMILSSYTPSLFWFRADMMKDMISKGCTVIAIGQESEEKWKSKFFEIGVEYSSIFVVRNEINPINDLKSFISIYKCLRKYKPDKLFVYQAKTIIYGATAARLLGIKNIYILFAGLGSILRGNSLFAGLIKLIVKTQYFIVCKFEKKVFFQNKDDLAVFINNNIVNDKKTVIINGSGVNLEKFIPTPLPKVTSFLFVGRLLKDKGIIEYLEACKIVKKTHSNVRCLLVGPFDSNPTAITEQELHKYIDEKVIEYMGETSDVRPYLNACCVFVLPSYHEGTPKSILEAMATERAIITTDAPGCRETVINNISGFLVPVNNIEVLAEKMIYLIEHPDVLRSMAKKSLELCKEKYDVVKVNNSILNEMEI